MLSERKKLKRDLASGQATGKALAVLLDRDGTLIRDVGHLSRVEKIELLPGVPEAIRLLRRNGLKVVIVTNQSAVGRGFLTESGLAQIHHELTRLLAISGAVLDAIYYCPHHPTEGLGAYGTACECRKPNAGLAQKAAEELNLDLGRSYVVGDQSSDMELALRIGAKGIRIRDRGPEGGELEDKAALVVVEDLWEAAQWIVRDLYGRR